MGVEDRRERESQARRESILNAARQLIRENGFQKTTTRMIAERCELSEGTLFTYFKGKEEIFTALLFEGIDYMQEGLSEIEDADLEPFDKLKRLWSFFKEMRLKYPEYFYVFARLGNPQTTEPVSEEVKREIGRQSGDNFKLLAQILQRLEDDDNIPWVKADLFWAAFSGLTILHSSRKNIDTDPPVHPTEEDLESAFNLLIQGITSKTNSYQNRE